MKFLVAMLIICGFVFAGECPQGTSACFLCGGVNGVPCTSNCQGAWDEASQMYVSCSCPQGEPCICHCPYGGGQAVYASIDDVIKSAGPCSDATTCPNCAIIESAGEPVAIKRGDVWCMGEASLVIGPGDSIYTGGSLPATIKLFDGGRMDIAPNSKFSFSSINHPAPGATSSLTIDLLEGLFRFLIEEKRIEQFEMRVDNAVLGVEGTEFLVDADDTKLVVKVLEGEVSADSVLLSENQYSEISRQTGTASAPAYFDPDSEDKWWTSESCCGPSFLLLGLLFSAALFRLPPVSEDRAS